MQLDHDVQAEQVLDPALLMVVEVQLRDALVLELLDERLEGLLVERGDRDL